MNLYERSRIGRVEKPLIEQDKLIEARGSWMEGNDRVIESQLIKVGRVTACIFEALENEVPLVQVYRSEETIRTRTSNGENRFFCALLNEYLELDVGEEVEIDGGSESKRVVFLNRETPRIIRVRGREVWPPKQYFPTR